jgi:uncharacterized protein YndB with AHSA1/START domain
VGPEGVSCIAAEVDLRVGGRYRIANKFPDGRVVWIVGELQIIEPPHRLTYTWQLKGEKQLIITDADRPRLKDCANNWNAASYFTFSTRNRSDNMRV